MARLDILVGYSHCLPTLDALWHWRRSSWTYCRDLWSRVFWQDNSSLEILAEAQALGGVTAFVDAEHALDPGYVLVLILMMF